MTQPGTPPNRRATLVTDAGCDLPAVDLERYGVRVAPLKILFGEESYRSGIDITHEQFYARLAQGDVHPSTSQPTVPDFVELYRELSQSGAPILSIHLSEGLSGTVNVARQAAAQLPELDITVHDSGTLTAATGFQVIVAGRALEAGRSVPEIIPLLEQTHAVTNLLFSVEDLMYLHRGGRIGSVRYQVGQLLNIKPIVTVEKHGSKAGTYVSAGRARSLAKAGEIFIERAAEAAGPGGKLRAVAVYGSDPTLAESIIERLRQEFDLVYGAAIPTAPVLGVHVGPGALGLIYAPGDWPV
ncbi:MAG: DegV family protein [Chloroflexi bacterium]|nr:DegV family protein [Chloroflexota bacterium]